MRPVLIDFTEYLRDQTLEETIKVLDDIMCCLMINVEEVGITENLSHQYLTVRNLRNTFIVEREMSFR